MSNLIKPFNYVTNYNFLTEFYICGYINTDNYNFIEQLKRSLDPNINVNRVPITIYIDSTGGFTNDALYITDIILNSPIETIGIGRNILSAATIVFIACTRRYVYKNNYRYGMHALRYTSNDIIKADIPSIELELDYLISKFIDIFRKRTSLSVSYLASVLSNIHKMDFFDDEDMINSMIVDEILE